MRSDSLPVLSGVGLIVACFFASAAMRLGGSGWALAEGVGELSASEAASGDAMLGAIQERETELDAEEKRLAERRQTLNVAEAKLAEQLAAFETAQKNLESTLAMADKAAENDITRMTAVYENMKPAEAAKIVERMDVSFAAGLLARMRPELAAEVLTGMNPDVAYAVTLTIASRNSRVPKE